MCLCGSQISKENLDCSSFVVCLLLVPHFFPFFFFLLWPLTILMRQTRQALHAINQSIFLRCLWCGCMCIQCVKSIFQGVYSQNLVQIYVFVYSCLCVCVYVWVGVGVGVYVYVCLYVIGESFNCAIIIKRVSWFKSSLLLRIQSDSFTIINS